MNLDQVVTSTEAVLALSEDLTAAEQVDTLQARLACRTALEAHHEIVMVAFRQTTDQGPKKSQKVQDDGTVVGTGMLDRLRQLGEDLNTARDRLTAQLRDA